MGAPRPFASPRRSGDGAPGCLRGRPPPPSYDGPMATIGRLAAGLGGAAFVLWVLLSALRSVVLPRGEVVLLTRWVFVPVRSVFGVWINRQKTYEQGDRLLALYAPISLVALPFTWIALVLSGF